MHSITNFTAFDENTEAIYSDVKKLKYFSDRIIKVDNEQKRRAKKGFQIKLLLFSATQILWLWKETFVKLDIHFAIYIQLGNYYR